MAKNDVVLLDRVLEAGRAQAPRDLDDATYFKLFVAEQMLESHDLSTDELLGGIYGGGDDEGIDGLYIFADGRLIVDEADLGTPREGIELSLVAFQARTSQSFGEKPIELLVNTVTDLLDLSLSGEDLERTGLYSSSLVAAADLIRYAIVKSATKRPRISVAISCATRGNLAGVSQKARARTVRLEDRIMKTISGATAEFGFHGAGELYVLAQQTRPERYELAFEGTLLDEGHGRVALVALEEYRRFLRDRNGALRRYIFEGHLRDDEGDVELNSAIAESTKDPDAPPFWWLNNGVTILAADASAVGGKLYLDSPLIVDGVQTSIVVHESLPPRDGRTGRRGQRLLVRILVENDPGTRDRIIRSINGQTRVSTASLRATESLQREIEFHFRHEGWFYERRKNHWRAQGKPADRIVQMAYLAQAVMAICFADPASARARPSSLLRDDADYGRIFDPWREYPIYLWAARTQKRVDAFLRSDDDVTPEEVTNLRFHLSTMLVAQALGRRVDAGNRNDVSALVGREFPTAELRSTLKELRQAMAVHRLRTGLRMDRVAKSEEFVEALLDALPRPGLRLVRGGGA